MLKLALGLHAGEAAPNAQLRSLNLHVGSTLRGVACALPVQLAAVTIGSGGVSSFGYSGTIAHAVLAFRSGAEAAGGGVVCARCSKCDTGRSTLGCLPTRAYRRCVFPWRNVDGSFSPPNVVLTSLHDRLAIVRPVDTDTPLMEADTS